MAEALLVAAGNQAGAGGAADGTGDVTVRVVNAIDSPWTLMPEKPRSSGMRRTMLGLAWAAKPADRLRRNIRRFISTDEPSCASIVVCG